MSLNCIRLGVKHKYNTYTEDVFQIEKRNRNNPKNVQIHLKYYCTLISAAQTTQSPNTSLLKLIPITQYK